MWATGYQPDYTWIDAPVLDAAGRVRHHRGVTDVPGLYFLGLYWQHTRGSALLGWVKNDAEFIATQTQSLADKPKARPNQPSTAPISAESSGGVSTCRITWTIPDRGSRRTSPPTSATFHSPRHPNSSRWLTVRSSTWVSVRWSNGWATLTVRMLAYNGSVPGPTMRVQQGSEVVINVTNEADTEATVHWHGLRLQNAYDGTHETQTPMQVGQSFSYRLQFHDPGVYWYHPHIREDYGQEMGLYGNIVVVPSDPDYWPPVNREELLTLDDVLLENGQIASFSRTETTYVAMGRFGNTMLIGGDVAAELSADLGEIVRFYFTNTANTRVFNVGFDNARMKLVGGDSGHVEHEAFLTEVMLAPSERIVVDVLFDQPGLVTLEHRHPSAPTPWRPSLLGRPWPNRS